jgi:DNA gyrase subunit A
MLNLKDMIHYFVEHRHDVDRRTQFECARQKRAHLEKVNASDNIDEVIALIKASKIRKRRKLIERFQLSDIQSRAIVEMRLRQLTGLEQDKLRAEYDEIMKLIEHFKSFIG